MPEFIEREPEERKTYPDRPTFAALLERAVTEPGQIAEAYSMFHGYSLSNQMLAAFQCAARGIPCGPINSFLGWKRLGRHVKRGERALWLWMPITRRLRPAHSTEQREDDTRD